MNFGIKLGRFSEKVCWYYRMANWWRLLVYHGKLRFERNCTTHPALPSDREWGLFCHFSSDSPTQQNSQGDLFLGQKFGSEVGHKLCIDGVLWVRILNLKIINRNWVTPFVPNSSFRNQLEKNSQTKIQWMSFSLIDWLRSWSTIQPTWHEKIPTKHLSKVSPKIWPLRSHLVKFTTSQELHQILQFLEATR